MFEYKVRQDVTSSESVYAVHPGGMRECTSIETTVMSRKVIRPFLPRAGEVIAKLGKVDRIEYDISSIVPTVILESVEKNHGKWYQEALQKLLDNGFSAERVIDHKVPQ